MTDVESTPGAGQASSGAFGPDEAAKLVHKLRSTFQSGHTRSVAWRRAQLDAFAAMMAEEEEALHAALKEDLGRPKHEAFLFETGLIQADIKDAKKHLHAWMRTEKVGTPLLLQPGSCRVERQPLGVVLIIAPWNYPLGLLLTPAVSAIAAGNCALLKPSELSPATSNVVAEIVPKYLDADAVRVVTGGGAETNALLEQPFDLIFFTGGGRVARIVMTAAAQHLTPVVLELGGKSPAIVDREVDLRSAARKIAWARYINSGQTCLAVDHVYVHRDVEEQFVNELTDAIRKLYGRDPKESHDYGRVVNEHHFDRLVALMKSGEVALGGRSDRDSRYIAPTILRGVTESSPIMQEEIFGPILPVLGVPDVGTAIAHVNARPRPLALYIFSKNESVIEKVLGETISGGACINDAALHYGAPELPFGGVGASGMGAYHGRQGFETMSHRRAVYQRSSFYDPPLRYPPYHPRQLSLLRKLL